VYPRRMVSQALRLGLLVTLAVLALSACGGGGEGAGGSGEKQDKGRTLPQNPEALRPGEYHSVEFEPSLSFRVGKGWANTEAQLPDSIEVGEVEQQEEVGWINVVNVKEVFKPGTRNVAEAPKDLVGWFQHHPYLKTDKPEPITVGGAKGVQFDVLVKDLPEDYYGVCGRGCVDIFSLSDGEQTTYFYETHKRRVIVLEDVKGKTVTIAFSSAADRFDEFTPEAKKVVDSVKWTGS
jgi:hypothetical protein